MGKNFWDSLVEKMGEDGARQHMAEIRAKRTKWKKPAKKVAKSDASNKRNLSSQEK